MNLKNIILGILLLVAIVIGGRSFFGESKSSPLLVSEGLSNDFVGNDLIVILLELKSLSLDGSVFEDKVFGSLKDFGTDIAKQPVGRDNPFSDIGVDIGTTTGNGSE